jgi:general secretion pathway protein B
LSYILEALRKAERERNPGQQTPVQIPAQRFVRIPLLRRYRPLLVALLCLGLLTLLALSLRRPHSQAAPAVAAVATINPAAPVPAAGAPEAATTLDQIAGDSSEPATLDDTVDSSTDTVSEAVAEQAPQNPAPSSPGISLRLSEVRHPVTAPPATEPAATEDAAPAGTEAQPEQPDVEHIQLAPAPPPEVSKLRDMPADYRATFPAISFDAHVYDTAPQKRFIMVGGKRYNEGDTLGNGLHIAQIVQDGVVFDFGGQQVLVNIAH